MDPVEAPLVELTPQQLETAMVDAAATEDQVVTVARQMSALGLRAIVVRPSDLDFVARIGLGSTLLGAACGYPDGSATTSVKIYEAADCLRRGAKEIHAVLNAGKLNSRQFQYVEMEMIQLVRVCHESGAKLRMILQSPWLTEEGRLVAAKIAKRSEVDSVIAVFGETPVEQADSLRRKCLPLAAVCGFAATLDGALAELQAGCYSVAVPDPAAILAEWNARVRAAQPSENAVLR